MEKIITKIASNLMEDYEKVEATTHQTLVDAKRNEILDEEFIGGCYLPRSPKSKEMLVKAKMADCSRLKLNSARKNRMDDKAYNQRLISEDKSDLLQSRTKEKIIETHLDSTFYSSRKHEFKYLTKANICLDERTSKFLRFNEPVSKDLIPRKRLVCYQQPLTSVMERNRECRQLMEQEVSDASGETAVKEFKRRQMDEKSAGEILISEDGNLKEKESHSASKGLGMNKLQQSLSGLKLALRQNEMPIQVKESFLENSTEQISDPLLERIKKFRASYSLDEEDLASAEERLSVALAFDRVMPNGQSPREIKKAKNEGSKITAEHISMLHGQADNPDAADDSSKSRVKCKAASDKQQIVGSNLEAALSGCSAKSEIFRVKAHVKSQFHKAKLSFLSIDQWQNNIETQDKAIRLECSYRKK